jgi:hypothetical protein
VTLRQPAFGHGGNARFDEEVTIMVSKAIASLEAWLIRAEEVLAEQREHAISPSLGPLEGDTGEEWTITVVAFSEGLEGLLEALCARPGRWILIVESAERPYLFWQALAFEDGSLVTEVVSNHYLSDEHHWTRAQEEQLLALGWEWHVKPYLTNWINVQATTTPDVGSVVLQGLTTLRELFGLDDEGTVFVKMFSSPLRGDTPAGPLYEAEQDQSSYPSDESIDEQSVTVIQRCRSSTATCEGSAGPVAG